MVHYIIYYIIFFTFLNAQTTQKFVYKTKFRSLNVGTTEITIQDNLLDTTQKIITIESFSNKWIDMLYKLRHYSTLIINSDDYSLLTMTQKVQQADYLDSYNIAIDYNAGTMHYIQYDDLEKEKEMIIPIKDTIYDPFAIVYYLQNLELEINQKHIFTYYSRKNIKSLELEILKSEKIKTPYSTDFCHLVVPKSTHGKYLLKNKGEMRIWYTSDKKQIPIKIQQKMRHGIMELLLEKYIEE